MSGGDINPYDWYKRFFGRDFRRPGFFGRDLFREFEEMQDEMEKMFNQFNDIQNNPPKELVREYQTPEGKKIREVGPIVYGYSITIGPDGKPKIREFGNVKSLGKNREEQEGFRTRENYPHISAEREPLADVNVTDRNVKVILEMPGVKKEEIKINAYEGMVEVLANDQQRRYHRTIEIPQDINIETATSTYNNGILEISFNKTENIKPKGREIKID